MNGWVGLGRGGGGRERERERERETDLHISFLDPCRARCNLYLQEKKHFCRDNQPVRQIHTPEG